MDSLIHLQTHAIRVPLQSAVLTQGQPMKVFAVILCYGFLDRNAIDMIKASFYLYFLSCSSMLIHV